MASALGENYSICVDGRMLAAGATGVGRYADTLLATLREAGAAPMVLTAAATRRTGWRWIRAVGPGVRQARRAGPGGSLVGPPELFQEAQIYFDLHRRLMPVEVDAPAGIMHWTYPVPLRLQGWRNLYTVHDAIPLMRPELTPIDTRRQRRLLQAVAGVADRLVAVSEAARRDIVETLGCPDALVTAVPQGVAALPAHAAAPAGLAPGGYFLACGSVEPRKNLARLAEAHAASGSSRPLVIAGPDGWRSAEVTAQLAGHPGVVRLPYQTSESLGALVRDARALLFPSLAEGFGLPVIEAMIMGVPVMASSLPALRETAGDAALLVDPEDIQAMAAAIARLDRDDALGEALSTAGRARAAAFSLPGYARRLAAVHAELMEPRA